jgi:hypothetical protein
MSTTGSLNSTARSVLGRLRQAWARCAAFWKSDIELKRALLVVEGLRLAELLVTWLSAHIALSSFGG